MINILSYVGMNMQSEVCLWCLLGLVRTIFDATLFKVNANLKQVWQMNMPEELSKPVQRVLRTMVSGIMLVKCFTVYIYLAAYIVLLYPVFLEERPALVLPWLLLAAVRKLLCELTSLALGLGTCLLLGPARQPCIKFVIIKFASIIPAFYMWMLVFSYYHTLKVAAAFKTFPANLPHSDNDYGLELAVRRRRTKSLLGEDQLRKKLVANFYGETTPSTTDETYLRPPLKTSPEAVISTDASVEDEGPEADVMKPPVSGWSDIGTYVYEDWFGSEITIPRDADRILEQFVLMLLRIGAYMKKGDIESVNSQIFNSVCMSSSWHPRDNIDCSTINGDATETPPYVGSSKGNIASYLRDYPQIFMKKQSNISQTELTLATLKTVHSLVETDENTTNKNKENQISPCSGSYEETSVGVEKVPSKKKITISDSIITPQDKTVKLTLPSESESKRTTKAEETKLKSKLKKQRATEGAHENCTSEIANKEQDDLQESKTSASDIKITASISKRSNESKKTNSTETLNNQKSKKKPHVAILDDENKTPKKKTDEGFTLEEIKIVEDSLLQSKQLNTADIGKETSYTKTIYNESNKRESTLSQFLNADNNDDRTSIKSDTTTLKVKKKTELFNETNQEEISFNSKILKAGTSSEMPKDDSNLSKNKEHSPKNAIKTELISKDDKNKELPLRILSNDDKTRGSPDVEEISFNSKMLKAGTSSEMPKDDSNLSKIKEHSPKNAIKTELISKDDKNKELPLRILSNDDKTRGSPDVNIANRDSKIKIVHEDGNEHLRKEMLNKDVSNKDSKLKCSYCNRECQNNESAHEKLPLRILSNDTIKNTQNVKVSDKDDSKGSTDDKAPKELGCNKIGCDCSKQPKHEANLHRKDHTNA